jgi:hypothetical protein
VSCTGEWRDVSAVEGPSRGGLGASEQPSNRSQHPEQELQKKQKHHPHKTHSNQQSGAKSDLH